MITRIELENFKGIRDRVSLDLKPITLLFGANSSGKSTIIHALHYALEVMKSTNLDADRTTLGGESVDLGGFRNLVHGHDLDRRIRMLFEFDAEGASLPDYTEGVSDTMPLAKERPAAKDARRFGQHHMPGADFDDRVHRAWVSLEIGWDRQRRGPQVFAYDVGTDDDGRNPAARIEAGIGKGQAASLLVHSSHPVFAGLESSGSDDDASDLAQELATAGEALRLNARPEPDMSLFALFAQSSALPTWHRPLRLWPDDEGVAVVSPNLVHVRRVLSKLVVGLGEMLVARLERLLYVGPLRTVPPRNYRRPLTEDLSRWADGLGAWDALHRQGDNFVSRVSKWLQTLGTGYRLDLREVRELDKPAAAKFVPVVANVQRLDALLREKLDAPRGKGAGPTGKRPRKSKIASFFSFDSAEAHEAQELLRGMQAVMEDAFGAMLAAPKRAELILIDDRSGVAVHPYDVGVGISQLLPVIVAALYRGERGAGALVAVEQPELHVHPKLQVNLADLFVEQACAGTVSDHQFLLETHSEHILLRLLRRIREANEAPQKEQEPARGVRTARGRGVRAVKTRGVRFAHDERPGDSDLTQVSTLTPDHVSIVYVQRGDDGSTQFLPLRIDETGEFRDAWPNGFFTERAEELF